MTLEAGLDLTTVDSVSLRWRGYHFVIMIVLPADQESLCRKVLLLISKQIDGQQY